MRKLIPWLILAVAAAFHLGGCSQPARAPAAPAPGVAAADTRGAALYAIDPAASEVLIYVYRGGALARLGHNHVLRSAAVEGRVWLHPRFDRSGFELRLPVAQLIVDEPALRQAAGPEFASEPSEAERIGTRRNMLRAAVLDAENHPHVQLRSLAVRGDAAAPTVTTLITLRGVARELQIPLLVERTAGRLVARGEFSIRQTDFGIEPFSVALGALQVQDRVEVRFRLHAQRAE